MKAVLALVLCGLVLSVESACDGMACTSPTSYTCSNLKVYIDCLTAEKGGCTTDAEKTNFDGSISSFTSTRNALGCGASMITVSVSALLLSLLAVFLKL